MLRILGFVFSAVLIVNAIGLVTNTVPKDVQLWLLVVGGLGLGFVAWRERRQP